MKDLTSFPSSVMASYYDSKFMNTLLEAGQDAQQFFLEDKACKRRCVAQQQELSRKKEGASKPKGP